MAWTKESANSSTGVATVSLSVTAGDLILVCAGDTAGGSTAFTFSDTVNTYTTVMQQQLAGTNGRTKLSLAWAVAATTATLTITASATPDQIHAGSFRHGTDTLNPSVDVTGTANDTQSLDISTTEANTLIFGASDTSTSNLAGANIGDATDTAIAENIVNAIRMTSEVYLADNSAGSHTVAMYDGSPARGVIAAAFTIAGGARTAAITGTATASITETDIVAGGKTVAITLSGDTWIAS